MNQFTTKGKVTMAEKGDQNGEEKYRREKNTERGTLNVGKHLRRENPG